MSKVENKLWSMVKSYAPYSTGAGGGISLPGPSYGTNGISFYSSYGAGGAGKYHIWDRSDEEILIEAIDEIERLRDTIEKLQPIKTTNR